MAVRLTLRQLQKRVKATQKILLSIIAGLRVTKQEQEQIFARGGLASEVKTAVDDKLGDLQLFITEAKNDITVLQATGATTAWARIIRTGNPLILDHFSLDVDNGSTKAEITFKDVNGNSLTLGTVPFTAGDKFLITKATDSSMLGEYTVESCTTSLLKLTNILPGSDNTDEKNLVMVLVDE